MLIACPNCGTSYGVEMATLRPPKGWSRQVRCHRCHCVWQAELSHADKLVVAANAVAPVRRAMAAAAQAAAHAAAHAANHAETWSPPLERATALLANELEAATTTGSARKPILAERLPAAPTAVEACAAAVAAFLGTVATRVARCYWRARRQDWRLQDWRPQISRLRLIIVGLILADAAIISWRTDLVWVMPQTASFYAELGLPVNVRGVQFEAITAAAERHDGEPVLIVKGEIGNGTNTVQAVPHLRFASATCNVRRYIPGPPRRRGEVWLPARR
jgi:predicted Zn finger-like uncharacterized protein